MPRRFSGDQERAVALAVIPDWAAVPGRDAITRSFEFRDFVEAFGFMTQVALVAERMDHHPEWSNVYRRVEVVLCTHDVGGVGPLDVALAAAIDALAARG